MRNVLAEPEQLLLVGIALDVEHEPVFIRAVQCARIGAVGKQAGHDFLDQLLCVLEAVPAGQRLDLNQIYADYRPFSRWIPVSVLYQQALQVAAVKKACPPVVIAAVAQRLLHRLARRDVLEQGDMVVLVAVGNF
jgi:hypothetical protein